MAYDMLLPEMGESVQEATIVKWHKNVGDFVNEDETIVEVATDKVDSEVPSPVSGKILELKMSEDDVAEIGAVIAVIAVEGSSENTSKKTTETVEDKAVEKTAIPEKSKAIKQTSEMSTKVPVYLPEMGESVIEANVNQWLKDVGDSVKEDENLLEVSTDKVDTEVPSPYTGKLIEICVKEGLVAQIGQVVAYIETDEAVEVLTSSTTEENVKQSTVSKENDSKESVEVKKTTAGTNNGVFSPLVRSIAKVENISLDELKNIQGSGLNNRITKTDLLSYINNGRQTASSKTASKSLSHSNEFSGNFPHQIAPVVVNYNPDKVEIIKMSTMRKGIAKHMVQSIYTAPHVFSIHEINMKKIWDWRNAVKGQFKAKHGFNLTFTHIIMDIVAKCIQKNPRINASIQGDQILVHKEINLGMAVGYTAKDGDNGLIVPVLRNCEEINLLGLARRANEFTHKARNLNLSIDETKGGTFTVTNVGVFGTEVGLGIINQPQVAILALGAIIKKAIVTADDAIAIAPMMKISMSYDHRVVDGMLAGQFLQMLQDELENFKDDASVL